MQFDKLMHSKLFALCSNQKVKYCTVCLITVGVSYLWFKSFRIEKFVRFTNKWLPVLGPQKLKVVSTSSETSIVVSKLYRGIQKSKKKILGLDCEWVSNGNKRHPVALLQLAAPDGFCSLIRLCSMQNIPTELVTLLEDGDILKVGVAVVTDARYLLIDYGVLCRGCVDLRYLASQVGVESRGLASLAKELFNMELDKDWRVSCSNWEDEELSQRQISYAAQDARIAVDIFNKLNHKEICKRHSILKRFFWTKQEYWDHTYRLWSQFIGLNFKSRPRDGGGEGSLSRRTKPSDIVIKRNYNTLLQRQHYSNIFLLAPDDQVLATISESKAAWYIENGLAEVVLEEPKTLRLTFEPSGRSKDADGYYTRPKDNKCVVCGCEKDLRRKNVVPSEYRRHFEVQLKNHHSHDVLLLCLPCHTRSNMHDQVLRDRLVAECDAPLADGKNNKLREMPDLKAMRSAARALYRCRSVIPVDRRNQLEAVICDKLGVSSNQLTTEFLENIMNIDYHVECEGYKPHGQKVVECYISNGGIELLEQRWRQHFLNTMSPRFLPQLWSVNYVRD